MMRCRERAGLVPAVRRLMEARRALKTALRDLESGRYGDYTIQVCRANERILLAAVSAVLDADVRHPGVFVELAGRVWDPEGCGRGYGVEAVKRMSAKVMSDFLWDHVNGLTDMEVTEVDRRVATDALASFDVIRGLRGVRNAHLHWTDPDYVDLRAALERWASNFREFHGDLEGWKENWREKTGVRPGFPDPPFPTSEPRDVVRALMECSESIRRALAGSVRG